MNNNKYSFFILIINGFHVAKVIIVFEKQKFLSQNVAAIHKIFAAIHKIFAAIHEIFAAIHEKMIDDG